MRSGQRAIFAGESSGGNLSNHKAGIESRIGSKKGRKQARKRICHLLNATLGDTSKRGKRDGDLIGGHGERLTVKVSPADDVAFAVFLQKNERIVRGAV